MLFLQVNYVFCPSLPFGYPLTQPIPLAPNDLEGKLPQNRTFVSVMKMQIPVGQKTIGNYISIQTCSLYFNTPTELKHL